MRVAPRPGRPPLLPGFIDTQVNGGGGVLFNDEPTVEAIRRIGRAHRRFGTTGFLPTLISDDLHVVARAIAASEPRSPPGCPACSASTSRARILNAARKGMHDATKFRGLDENAIAC